MNKEHRYQDIEIKNINLLVKNLSNSFIELCEKNYTDKLQKITNIICSNPTSYKILLLSGPSSSGKTTTAQLLQNYLRSNNIGAWVISLDDFFLEEKKCPVLKNGTIDYESVESLDIPLIHKCLYELVEYSTSNFPVFDFIKNQRSSFTRTLNIGNNDILILEGLHALNPMLIDSSYSNQCLKAYVSTSTNFLYKNKVIIHSKDLRLIRRIIRDSNFRNTKPLSTVKFWSNVCNGEKLYIDPFKDTAEIFIDSCIQYEPCLFKNYIKNIVDTSDKTNPYFTTLNKLYNKLKYFYPINNIIIPQNSILREFIGLT